MTLHPFLGVHVLKPFTSSYEDYKYKFSRINGIENVSPVMERVGDEPMFPFSWTLDSNSTMRVDSRVLPPLDCEVIQVLECFRPVKCSTLITQDVKMTMEWKST